VEFYPGERGGRHLEPGRGGHRVGARGVDDDLVEAKPAGYAVVRDGGEHVDILGRVHERVDRPDDLFLVEDVDVVVHDDRGVQVGRVGQGLKPRLFAVILLALADRDVGGVAAAA